MDDPTGNMSPKEAEKLCRQEVRDYSISIWNACDEATMRTDAWSSDEEHDRQGEEAEAERMLRTRQQVANSTSRFGSHSWIFFQS